MAASTTSQDKTIGEHACYETGCVYSALHVLYLETKIILSGLEQFLGRYLVPFHRVLIHNITINLTYPIQSRPGSAGYRQISQQKT